MDFNSGWMLPHVPGIVSALEEITRWNLEVRKAKWTSMIGYFTSLYSNEAIIEKWKTIIDSVVPEINSGFTKKILRISSQRKKMLRACQILQEKFQELHVLQKELQENSQDIKKKSILKTIVSYISENIK
jgi:hypothetical protein